MRKRIISVVLVLVLVLSLMPAMALAADETVSVAAGDTTADYTWNYVESETYGEYYELTNVVYVGAPVAADYQSLHVYIPAAYMNGGAVNGYTAETAPVIMANSASGWAGKTPSTIDGFGKSLEMDWAGILAHGYVLVSIGTRGPATQNDDGTYNGKAPENVADAKAAVRFLKANDAVIPGDMNRIISAGTSGGGGMSTIIGASGNAEEYLPYLYAINACGVEKQGDAYVNTGDDSVFGMLAYAPITDLDNADLGYNWFYGAQDTYTDFEKAVAEDMAAAFDDYILGLGAWESMDEFKAGFVAMFEEALNAAGGEEGEWIVKNEDGTYSIAGDTDDAKLAAIVANHNSRGKGVLGFDNLTPGTDSRAENQLFGLTGTTTNRMHYSEAVANIMLGNKDEYSKLTEGEERWSEGFRGAKNFDGGGYTAFQNVYSANEGIPGYTDMIDAYETALTDEMKARVYMMNPINYIIEYMEGSSDVQPAEHFRGVYGSDDSNTSPTVIYTVKEMLELAGIDAEYSMFWNGGHGKFTKEAAEVENFFAWVEDICNFDVCASRQSITVDGEEVEAEVYNIEGNNYFKLRDVAALLNNSASQFSVIYSSKTNSVVIATGEAYTVVGGELEVGEDKSATCVESAQTIIIDGEVVELSVYNIGGHNYFKLRELGEALGFHVDYIAETNTAAIYSFGNGITEGGTLYNMTGDIAYLENPTTEYQYYDLYIPEGEAPADGWPLLIYVHGGGFTKGDKQEAGSSLNAFLAGLDYGYAVAAINYTVTGEKTVEAIRGEIVDVKAALRYFKVNAEEFGFDDNKFILAGPSAGGGLVQIVGASWNSEEWDADLAALGAVEANEKVAAIIAYAGAAHFDDVYPEQASVYFDADDPALFLRHGDADTIVVYTVSEAMAKAAEEAGMVVDYRVVEGAKHTFQNFFALYDVAETFEWLEDIVK